MHLLLQLRSCVALILNLRKKALQMQLILCMGVVIMPTSREGAFNMAPTLPRLKTHNSTGANNQPFTTLLNFYTMKELTAANVHEIILKCLFGSTEKTDGAVIVEGVQLNIGFDPARLVKHKGEIEEMLLQLPDEFMQTKGGGWSFLNAVNNKHGHQWADMHATIDELLCLGLAIDKIAYNAPRQWWTAFPGSMPYFYVKN